MIQFRRSQASFLALCLLVAGLHPLVVSAADYTSGSFDSRDPVINNYGGNSTSASFQQTSSGGQGNTGESTSSGFILRSGFLYFDTFNPRSQNWRWYDDESNETPATALAAENVAPNIDNLNLVKLRLAIKETSNIGDINIKFKLQFSQSSTFASGISDVVEIGGCNGASQWCYADGAGGDNGVVTTKVLSDADSCASSTGNGCGTHNESGVSSSTFTHKKLAATEYEFTLKQSGAAQSTVYYFRAFDLTHGQPVSFNTGEAYPSAVASGSTLTFAVNGVAASTSLQGVTTNVTTTGTTVSFGALPFGSIVNAAQQLLVTTNASSGYQITVLQQQAFLGAGSAQIPPIANSNSSPGTWASGCTGSLTGCYGYHTGDTALAGGSTRFSATDTYAKFETTAREVVYSSQGVTNESTDFVYRVQITNQQVPGSYATQIIYIATPTF